MTNFNKNDATYDPEKIRVPIHPSACVVCRRCLFCSHYHGEVACNCAGLGLAAPSRGVNLPSNMQDSRNIGFNFKDASLREYTIKWIEERAHKIYQPLYYLSAVQDCNVNVCTAHFYAYLLGRKNHFKNILGTISNPPKLLPGTPEHDKNEQIRKIIHYPTEVLHYLVSKSPAWNKKKLNRRLNKCSFHLLRLDTCDTLHYKQGSLNRTEYNSSTSTQGKARDKRPNHLIQAINLISNQLDNDLLQSAEINNSNNNTGQVNDSGTSSTESILKDDDYISVSIWNAPSLSHWLLTSSNSQIDETVPRLLHLNKFTAADRLLAKKMICNRNENVRSLIANFMNIHRVEALPNNFGVRCVKDWNLIIDLDADFTQFQTVIHEKHIDIYIGTISTRGRRLM